MKRIIANIFIALVFLTGLSVLLYPTVSDYLNEKHASRAIAVYNKYAGQLPPEDYSQELETAVEYNKYIAQFKSLAVAAMAEKDKGDSFYKSLLNVGGEGIMAVIKIPSINVNLPIYHGTEERVLQVAVGHYQGSSLPIGGASTHAILTGHRGLPSAKLFTDLDRLEVGDIFYIKVLGDILEYEIDQIETVLPSELDSLSITPGEDYVTLVTCTPYGINSHRMLVRGTRVQYDGNYEEKVPMKPAPKNSDIPSEERGNGLSDRQWIIIAVAAFAAAILLGLLIPGKKKPDDSKGSEQEQENAGRRNRKFSRSSKAEKKEGSHEKKK
ncbi:MAG: class C sortase [Lachnospiraceae bacterium]|nr:class C sortase [Lachnospiraceae bacterium]